jgi:hypothetical protein
MSEPFDPYQAWLGLPPGERPPDHYRLLGVRRFEKRAEAIEAAADARIAALRPHQSGEHAQPAARLLAEVNAARLCLLNDNRRASYDIGLLQKVAATVAEEEKGGQVQVTAAAFLATLAQRDLVPADLLLAIRKQMSDSKSYVTARHVAKLLVDKGLLTPILVSRLLETAARAASQAGATSAEPRAGLGSDELAFAPLDDEPRKMAPPQPKPLPTVASRGSAPRSSTEKARPPALSAATSGSFLDEELKALSGASTGGPLDELWADASFQAAAGAGNPLLPSLPRHRQQRFWTSPGFLIGAAVVWILLLIGAMLIVAMNRPGDEENEPSESVDDSRVLHSRAASVVEV